MTKIYFGVVYKTIGFNKQSSLKILTKKENKKMPKTLEEQMAELVQQNLSANLVEEIFKSFDQTKIREIMTQIASEEIKKATKGWQVPGAARKAAEEFVREKILEIVKEEVLEPKRMEKLVKTIANAFAEAVTAVGKRIGKNLVCSE